RLLNSNRRSTIALTSLVPKYLKRSEESRWSSGSDPLPTRKWLPLIAAITHPSQIFSQENSLLKLAEALGRSKSVRSSTPEVLTPLNVQVRSEDWQRLSNPSLATLDAR